MVDDASAAVGFFGGTFDPVHIGHINLVVRLQELARIKKVIVAPSPYTPQKSDNRPTTTVEHRAEMLKIAFAELPGVEVRILEEGPGPFYLIDTLEKKLPQNTTLFFGEDVLEHIDSWKDVKKLFTLARPLIATREHSEYHLPSGEIGDCLKDSIVHIPEYTISSTEIRDRLVNKKFCEHLVPAKVLDYIYQNGLYSP